MIKPFIRSCRFLLALCAVIMFAHTACSPIRRLPPQTPPLPDAYEIDGKKYYPLDKAHGFIEEGVASWYGADFHGKKTANSEIYNMHAMTAAHKTLPLGTVVEVNNLENGKNAVVRINDRGPYVGTRIIDLSYEAATQIGMVRNGTAKVKITALGTIGTRAPRSLPPDSTSPALQRPQAEAACRCRARSSSVWRSTPSTAMAPVA